VLLTEDFWKNPSLTNSCHDGDCKEESFGEGPRVFPVVGRIVLEVCGVINDK
jgi:hypothetical protein